LATNSKVSSDPTPGIQISGMWLLDWSGPGVHVAELVVLADVLERARFGPCPDDQIVRLGESFPACAGFKENE